MRTEDTKCYDETVMSIRHKVLKETPNSVAFWKSFVSNRIKKGEIREKEVSHYNYERKK